MQAASTRKAGGQHLEQARPRDRPACPGVGPSRPCPGSCRCEGGPGGAEGHGGHHCECVKMRLLVVKCCRYHAPGRASPWARSGSSRVAASTGIAASNKWTPHSGTPAALVCTWLLVRGAAIMYAPPRTQPSGAPPQTQPGSAQPGVPHQAGPARVHLYPTPIPGRQPGRALSIPASILLIAASGCGSSCWVQPFQCTCHACCLRRVVHW